MAIRRFTHAIGCAVALAMSTMLAGCGSAPATSPSAPSPEGLLTAAGFKTVVASTDAQLKHLPTIPAGQVTVISQTGKNFFVYPDLAKNQIYVGTQKEYQAYLKLRVQNNLPLSDPEASYFKQDAGMPRADQRDESAPWTPWPNFDGLGWQ